MSTSDWGGGHSPPTSARVPEGAQGREALPDPQLMASWANEFFRAGMAALETAGEGTSGRQALPVATPDVGALSAPSSSFPSGFDPFGLETPRMQQGIGPGAAPYAPPVRAASAYGSELGVGPTGASSPDGAFYFLEHAREQVERSRSDKPATEPVFASSGNPVRGVGGLTAAPRAGVPSFEAPSRSSAYDAQRVPQLDVRSRQFDPYSLRRDFPILSEQVNGKPLIWLDNAATTQKPQCVIDRISYFYEHENSNIHRAAHTLAARATDAYEGAREKVRRFLNAPSSNDIVFTRGTTEAINLVAQSWGRRNLREGDEIVITWLEHHSNIVPWQLLCKETGAKLRVAPVDDRGEVLLDEYERLFNARTRFVSITHVSNALGTVTPAREMVAIAHRHGARVLVDGAQAVSHMRVDVQELDCDFYVFSGHKVFGPTGIGALYGKADVLDAMPPWQGGGNMIADVTFDKTVYHPAPMRFEAGTGNIADAVGLGAALDYVERIGMDNIARHEHELLVYGTHKLLEIPRLRLIGTARDKAGVLSFVIDGLRTEQIGAALAKQGIAVRSGHHCAQPALRRYGLESTVRPSLALYNTCEDLDALVDVLRGLQSNSLS